MKKPVKKAHRNPAAPAPFGRVHKRIGGKLRTVYRTNPAAPGLAPCFEGYVEAALFASTDDEGRPLDENFSRSDFSPESLNQMYDDCDKFIEDNQEDISEFMDVTGRSMADVGHDFFLTRCGHGAGFWDRGAGAVGERLSNAAADFGHQDVYVDDEGELHVSGGARSNPRRNGIKRNSRPFYYTKCEKCGNEDAANEYGNAATVDHRVFTDAHGNTDVKAVCGAPTGRDGWKCGGKVIFEQVD